jgi:hypothetical protein
VSALDGFLDGVRVAQRLWAASQDARAAELKYLADAASAADEPQRSIAQRVATEHQQLHRALVESAAVRLATAWEVFLHELFVEFVKTRPDSLAKVWSLGPATTLDISDETIVALVRHHNRPFQDIGKAREVLKSYLGDDLFKSAGDLKGPDLFDFTSIRQLLVTRHAIVHRGGRATDEFRRVCDASMEPHGYLMAPPHGTSIPSTHFERLVGEVSATCVDLYKRAFDDPRS